MSDIDFSVIAEAAVFKLSDQNKKDLTQAFYLFDADGGGAIGAEELYQLMVALGQGDLTQKQVEDMVEEVDLDGSGEIDLDEFLQVKKSCNSRAPLLSIHIRQFRLLPYTLDSSDRTRPQITAAECSDHNLQFQSALRTRVLAHNALAEGSSQCRQSTSAIHTHRRVQIASTL